MSIVSGNDTIVEFSPAPYVRAGLITIVLAFGAFGGWAALAPLAGGVVASAMVSVETNRKSIQHLEGGIIKAILVEDGDVVEAGAELVRLDATQAQSNFAMLNARLIMLLATEARLNAESVSADVIDFPPATFQLNDPDSLRALSVQQALFADRRATRDGQIEILRSRIEQLRAEAEGLRVQLEATRGQRDSLVSEIERLTAGEKSGVVATNQLSQMLREQMELQGAHGSILSQIATVGQTEAETELQIIQIGQQFKERASDELRDIRSQLNEVSERVLLARDVLERTTITAPVRGIVQGLRVHSAQGVIRAAEPIMDIIPIDDDLVITARIRPLDIDSVSVGGNVEVKFTAFQSRTMPTIYGTVTVVSTDVIDPQDGRTEPYYQARIRVEDDAIPLEVRGRLVPGMPAEVVIATGERTLMQYLAAPIISSFGKGMREE
jgi:HlyD family type I secretion membrane fusion protein